MSRPITEGRFVGDTKTCFHDLISKYPGLKIHTLMVEFFLGHAKMHMVQAWQREEHFPGGDQLLRLRCFLYLAGYDVTEFRRLNGDSQKLLLILGLGILEPLETAKKLGYTSANPLDSLWRILLQAGGYSEEVEGKIQRLYRRHRKELDKRSETWRQRIADTIGELPATPTQSTELKSFGPRIPVSFARLVGTAIALGRIILDNEEEQAVLDATRGGLDLEELIGVLQQYSSYRNREL